MPKKSFDISTLLQFSHARYLCENCFALLPTGLKRDPETDWGECPVCGVKYLTTDRFPAWWGDDYLKSQHLYIEFKDLESHCAEFAWVARDMRLSLVEYPRGNYINPPLYFLLRAFSNAGKFIHFTSYGLSHMFLGALRMVTQNLAHVGSFVNVRGVVSNVDNQMRKELTEHQDVAPNMEVRIFERSEKPESWDAVPHQKIIIIDGVMAIKGSANLTVSGWRKAAQGREIIEVVTDIREVIDLNNRFFSPVWAEFSDVQEIVMR